MNCSARQLGDMVRVDVRDSGPGIPPEEQKRIFEAFYRLRNSEKAVEGTGLGLAITQRLVELHGGQLGIESQPGSGSCFYFTLPRAITFETEDVRQVGAGFKTGESIRILVVEDNSAAAHLLQSHLTSAGYGVELCNQPQNVVERAAQLQPGAVTLDVIMTPINGWELLTNLKSDPRTAQDSRDRGFDRRSAKHGSVARCGRIHRETCRKDDAAGMLLNAA